MGIWKVGLFGLLAVTGLLFLSSLQIVGVDLGPLWAAGVAPDRAYDFQHVTLLQPWRLGSVEHPTLRPFVYPPTVLLLAMPLGRLHFAGAYAIWVATTGLAYAAAGRAIGAPLWFLLFAPVVAAVATGQTTLLVAALVIAGLLKPRTLVAGLAFGLAACVKPQLLLLLPVALLAQGAWRTILATAATGMAVCGLATLVLGWAIWGEWLGAVRAFGELILHAGYLRSVATPYGFLALHGVEPRLAFLALPFVVAWVWWAFRKEQPLDIQLLALGGGALLVGAYAYPYDLSLVAPAVAIAWSRADLRFKAGTLAFAAFGWSAPLLALLAAASQGLPPLSMRPAPVARE